MQVSTYYMPIINILFYIYAWVAFQTNHILDWVLENTIRYVPDYFIPDTPFNQTGVKILYAVDQKDNDILKRLKLYLYFKWDYMEEFIDLDRFTVCLDSECILVGYQIRHPDTIFVKHIDKIMDCDILSLFNTQPQFTYSDNRVTLTKWSYQTKVYIINTQQKFICELDMDKKRVNKIDILYGEVRFE
jgi:hypothetical protein